jgi:predicted transcriptional regulator
MARELECLVKFCKALADENRLKLIGLLAHKPHSVEELAANLGISSATVSHHLARLAQADLVEARVQQYYNIYMLKPDTFRRMAEQILSPETIKAATPIEQLGGYAARVLDDYLAHGKLKTIPSQIKKREVILRHLADEFQVGKRYSEKRVNEILKAFHPDYATLRHDLLELNLLTCEKGMYWRPTA